MLEGFDIKYLYFSDENQFYPYSLKESYEQSGVWPQHGVEISEDDFQLFINPPDGKQVSNGENGYPALIDLPPPTREQLIAQSELERDVLLEIANNVILPLQTRLVLGRASEKDKALITKWLDYIDVVLAMKVSTTSKTVWPNSP